MPMAESALAVAACAATVSTLAGVGVTVTTMTASVGRGGGVGGAAPRLNTRRGARPQSRAQFRRPTQTRCLRPWGR